MKLGYLCTMCFKIRNSKFCPILRTIIKHNIIVKNEIDDLIRDKYKVKIDCL